MADKDNDRDVLLRVEHLCQYFRLGKFAVNKAVDDVSFDIKQGEVFGLVGESGCGKTTTGRSIIKLYDITGGNVWFKGQRISAGTRTYKDAIAAARKEKKTCTDEARKAELDKVIADNKALIDEAKKVNKNVDRKLVNQIQMIFQDPIASLDPRMTVRDIIAEGLIIRGIKDKQYIDNKVYEMLETVGLVREHASRYPHEFSGGQRQRIGVARAVIMEPSLLIADEPISALDVSIRAQIMNLMNDLREKMGLTIMFIAHDLSVVKYFSDRIGVMYFGHLVELADSEELFRHPLHPYTRSLLSAIPQPDPEYERNRKRIVYNPVADHDYRNGAPTFREVCEGHFVLCDDAEFEKYRKIVSEE
ncbi:MAG: ATP-binding cassette domain-containing protein [Spirochaetales bacterium]|nr:ATP-binding cassette domain-containing protein [Spirochaetales bacterium]